MKSSAPAPTKLEAERMAAIKEGPCVACWMNDQITLGNEAHHLLSGGIRRGHRFTVALCQWHHRGVPLDNLTHRDMRAAFGPALSEGSKPFRFEFGSDDTLLRIQDEILKDRDASLAARIAQDDQRRVDQ